MNNLKKISLILPSFFMLFTSCQKFLDKKPEKGFYVPEKWQDLQALLDNNTFMNFQSGTSLIELITDNYYVTSDSWISALKSEKDNYIWDINAEDNQAWGSPYQTAIYYSNVVLDNVGRIHKTNDNIEKLRNIEGSALFFRSFAFHYLSQLYCKPYHPDGTNEKGIVLKKTAAVDEKMFRSTIKDTYQQILNDLETAVDLLPEKVTTTMRPCKAAALALLSRVYLSMSDYNSAEQYANLALQKNQQLLDFNELTSADDPLLPPFENNPEIIFFNYLMATNLMSGFTAKIDSTLYSSYDADDIRKKAFFIPNAGPDSGTYRFRGSYLSLLSESTFNGLTTGELFLIKAECLAKNGKTTEALEEINFFLRKRYTMGTFQDYVSSDPKQVLEFIRNERRKELVFRGQRWSDIRRFNKEGKHLELKRKIDGVYYSLPPNDLRSVLLIPRDEIARSGVEQNPR